MPRLFLTRNLPDAGVKLLKRHRIALDIYPGDRPIPRRELLRRLRAGRYDGCISLLTDHIDADVMDAAGPQLKVISNYAVGFDNIDLPAAKARKIVVTNTPSPEVVEAVAEHTVALLFALTRRIVESDRFARAGHYQGWGPQLLMGTELTGKTLGIVGMGAIGMGVAHRLYDGFGLKILYTNLEPHPEAEARFHARRVPLTTLLKQSDVVTLHVPLLPTTRHLISTKEFRLMKRSAFLINTSRGPVVNEIALIDALRRQQIAGAALDVFEHEPHIPATLKRLERLVLTPHTASATEQARQAMSLLAAENALAVLRGKKPKHLARI